MDEAGTTGAAGAAEGHTDEAGTTGAAGAAAGANRLRTDVQSIRRALGPFLVDHTCGVHVHVSAALPPRVDVEAVPAHVNPVSLLKLLLHTARLAGPILHVDQGITMLKSIGSMCQAYPRRLPHTPHTPHTRGTPGMGLGDDVQRLLIPGWVLREQKEEMEQKEPHRYHNIQ